MHWRDFVDKLTLSIVKYLDYINKSCGLSVSIHFEEKILNSLSQNVLSMLLKYNIHSNPYCIAVKRQHHNKCVLYQKNIIKSCANESFCSLCHSGVLEYIYPIFKDNAAIGFIAISGYRKKEPPSGCIDYSLWKKSLTKEKMPKELYDAIIPPLKIMLEQLFEHHTMETITEYNMFLQFASEYHNSITLSDLCNHFGRSKSYISHMFKQKSGKTLRTYCNDLKLEDSKKLLIHTNASITSIAFDVGFNDTSYFIHLFKKKYGISPLKYRKSNSQ